MLDGSEASARAFALVSAETATTEIDHSVVVLASTSAGAGRWTVPFGGRAKRVFDICFAACALVLLSPFMFAIALAIRVETPGPSLFRQERGGLQGRTFRIWKFRTMMMEAVACPLRQVAREDDRVTPLGRFLRKTSLDEFPQLVNVLLGEMSIVGPRPHAVQHDLEFTAVNPRYYHRFVARPGITGLAQISGCRGPTLTAVAIDARLAYDLDYVERWSLKRDVFIIASTFGLLRGDPLAF